MKILIYSPLFYPSVGGTETVVSILADEFVAQGNEVKIVTQTVATDSKNFPFEVFRKPNPQKLLKLVDWCEVYFQPTISLKGLWPLLIRPKPWIVSHNNWYTRPNGSIGWQDYLKQLCIRFASNISVSQAIAAGLSTPSTVISNPYQEEIFSEIPEISRNKELVFLGRLVTDKGADLLLEAMGNIKHLGLTPKLTIIGSGTEEDNLREQAKYLGIDAQVDFVGVKLEKELARILNGHKILVVPSRWQEPFGIVALEGIACGCVVVGSEGGGLKDAIGPCGVTFPNGNVQALTQALFDLLTNSEKLNKYRKPAKLHLLNHKKTVVAKEYLKVFERAMQ
ncbi:glycosyltransferase family 4 protein [Phormidium sp. LEGE 05292]|uniref:glycosyltransferase family 4 protein n=1 Tax=[Phormidium] sp. LEGE 05292 TaxID=767427 RepID=UPI00187DE2FD|nr:glycosyltransferase family 4 protein [Phormidium sp. LEGE 05292]MBE9224273.1 glycosyltransferase family 4 protein [Phormidium sp. LEGE 05292]